MKSILKITNSILVFIILLSLTILPVEAQTKGNTPDPNFKANGVSMGNSRLPFYGANANVDEYLSGERYYSEDTVSRQIVEIEPQVMSYSVNPTFSAKQLKAQAQKIISNFLGNKIKLSALSFTLGQKIGTYFFRWEDRNKILDNGGKAFIQVGLSQNGDFLNLVNTLPFGHNASHSQAPASSDSVVSPQIGPFNEVYANGGSHWSVSGSFYFGVTGGYYYLYPSGCSGSFCSKFYYSYVSNCGTLCVAYGTWRPSANTKTKAAAFIPSTYATATVTYSITPRSGNQIGVATVDQNAYYNTWVSITPSQLKPGILTVDLGNYGTSDLYVAWDEMWVYNP